MVVLFYIDYDEWTIFYFSVLGFVDIVMLSGGVVLCGK